jgi:hypothetical protein
MLVPNMSLQATIFQLTWIVLIINVQCYVPLNSFTVSNHVHTKQNTGSRMQAGYDHNDDVKTVDILSLETIRSTLVRQGTEQLKEFVFCYPVCLLTVHGTDFLPSTTSQRRQLYLL